MREFTRSKIDFKLENSEHCSRGNVNSALVYWNSQWESVSEKL